MLAGAAVRICVARSEGRSLGSIFLSPEESLQGGEGVGMSCWLIMTIYKSSESRKGQNRTQGPGSLPFKRGRQWPGHLVQGEAIFLFGSSSGATRLVPRLCAKCTIKDWLPSGQGYIKGNFQLLVAAAVCCVHC
jgi:hypothetical protein